MLRKSELDPIMTDAYCEGQARFGDLGLSFETYAGRIAAIVKKYLGSPSKDAAVNFVKGLHGRDLYLTTACAQNSPGSGRQHSASASLERAGLAWKTLETTYKTFICDLVRFSYRTSFATQDLADNILAELFLPDRSGTSRIASYDGRSSLSTWLRVVVCNRAINAQRCSSFSKSSELKMELPDGPALRNLELIIRAERYGTVLEDSVASACRGLTPRERLILLWRYEDGLQLGEIAKLLGIHQSNVTRQMERMQSKLRDDVVSILSRKHGLSGPAIQECLEDIVENPRHGISVLEFVRTSQKPRHEDARVPRAKAGGSYANAKVRHPWGSVDIQ
ncbi:MAG TPA: sigma-70 family RNA polymerase sigma factor [Terriglobales bacterium]|nr:sigma-70 family RNA polymerase sigma factor [Terriglobales bacterium]